MCNGQGDELDSIGQKQALQIEVRSVTGTVCGLEVVWGGSLEPDAKQMQISWT